MTASVSLLFLIYPTQELAALSPAEISAQVARDEEETFRSCADRSLDESPASNSSGSTQAPEPSSREPGTAIYGTLTEAQKSGRPEIDGGNWTVSFEVPHYLGFVVIQTSAEGKTTQSISWSKKPLEDHAFHFQHHVKGDDGEEHELTFSDASSGAGESGTTHRFRDPEFGHSQVYLKSDLSFRPGDSLLGRTRSLYRLSDLGGKPVFILKIVFAEDTAVAEKELKEKFDRQYGPRQPR